MHWEGNKIHIIFSLHTSLGLWQARFEKRVLICVNYLPHSGCINLHVPLELRV